VSEHLQVHIMSAIPGRVRLKVPRGRGMLQTMQRIADALSLRDEVSDVQVHPHTGSILVHYDPERVKLDELHLALQLLGIAIHRATTTGAPSSVAGVSEASATITRKVAGLNAWVGQATNGLGDLRLFVPLGLAAITTQQIVRHGLKVHDLPWYVGAWYAYQSFVTLNRGTRVSDQAAPAEAETSSDAQVA